MPHVKVAIKEEDRLLIKRAYQDLLDQLPDDLDEEDKQLLDRAYELGLEAHAKQRRKSGEPYFLHPIEVARICYTEIGLGPTALVCALLHDVVEDTDVTLEEVIEMFGPKIGKIVDGLTKLDGLYNVESPQAANFKKVLSTLIEDVRVVLIKMADRLHNLRTIGPMPRHKQLKIAAETSYIYSPLAHRLGLYNIKTEFQDICLKINEPEVYTELEAKLLDSKGQRERYVKEFIKPLKNELDQIKVPYRITGRPKSVASIYTKIKTKKVPFEEIYDLFAVRIIVEVPQKKEKQICWQVYSIVTDVHKPIPERLKDWVTTPKSNGYESLHTTVIGPKGRFVEVQIRSERMDEIAERGFAAHWKYKGVGSTNVYDNWLDNVRDILEDGHNDALEFMSDFKTNLFQEEVYVFTPNGDMQILPKGATALDFAFSIHTDIGYHATAIKVNNKLVPMGYKLSSGDQIQVITNKNQKPNENWLKLVVTGKARSKIRSAMKEEVRKRGETGKEALQRKLKHIKADFEANADMLVKHFGFTNRPELYVAIAQGQLNLAILNNVNVLGGIIKFEKAAPAHQIADKQNNTKPSVQKDDNQSRILINGESADQYKFSLARCCNPVQGDDIFGYLTSASGLKIHRTTCPNALHLMANYGYRIMKAEWSNTSSSNFVVDLLIIGVDDGPGVIERITSNISSKLGLNIRSFNIHGDEGYFQGQVSLQVANKDQLTVAIRELEKLKGISSVTRMDKNTKIAK